MSPLKRCHRHHQPGKYAIIHRQKSLYDPRNSHTAGFGKTYPGNHHHCPGVQSNHYRQAVTRKYTQTRPIPRSKDPALLFIGRCYMVLIQTDPTVPYMTNVRYHLRHKDSRLVSRSLVPHIPLPEMQQHR